MRLHLKIWRQKNRKDAGKFADYEVDGILEDMSFLEMLDVLNERLTKKNEEPVTFDHDCREGICGTCGFMINGLAHGGMPMTTVCQLYMRNFKDGDTLVIEPWRAAAFPVIKDLAVNRTAFDRIIESGGYVSNTVGSAPDGNAIPIAKSVAEAAFDSATCIGCGACVAACKNASAMLFTSAKISQMALLPQGQIERTERVQSMVAAMDAEKFGACTNEGECSAVCPKGISFKNITRMNSEFIQAKLVSGRVSGGAE
jgi:succinate dehydrogenase / fumarate reductase iron-sulfur subunit